MTELLTPYILALLAILVGVVGWLCTTVIQQGKDVVAVQTVIKYYFEVTGKGAARVLDSPNPTPPEMRILLRKYQANHLTESERRELKCWLRDLKDDQGAPKSERSAAVQLLAAMEAIKIMRRDSAN